MQYSDDRLKSIINKNIGYCEGVGAVGALRRKGIKNAMKIVGCKLWLELIKENPQRGCYFVGGATKETIEIEIKKIRFSKDKYIRI